MSTRLRGQPLASARADQCQSELSQRPLPQKKRSELTPSSYSAAPSEPRKIAAHDDTPEETMTHCPERARRAPLLLLLLSAAALSPAAQAISVDTKGGLKVTSDDGEYEMSLGGRIHLDANIVSEDDSAVFGSSATPSNSSAFFRRARISFAGRAKGWEYALTPDFAQSQSGNLPSANCLSTPCSVSSSSVAFQELYVARQIGPGKWTIGQFTPYRSIEDQTSSNEVVMIERAITSASGVYRGGISRLFQIGSGYLLQPTPNSSLGIAIFNLRRDSTPATEGLGGSLRATWAPLMADRRVLHLGASASMEKPDGTGAPGNVGTLFSYAGLRGPTAALGATSGGETAQYLALEAGTVLGAFHAQGEVVQARYGQAVADDSTTLLYHLTLSVAIFGEAKPYDAKKGAFRSIKPRRDFGALELTARHEGGENRDARLATEVERVAVNTVGLNYYFSPNVRLMANYVLGAAERVDGQKDEPRTLALRFQMAW